MNKLFITKSALFTLTVILMLLAWVSGVNNLMTASTVIAYLLLLALAVISIIDYVKKKDIINNDKSYNLLSIVSFIFMLIVLIRTFVDCNIVTVGLSNDIGESSTKMVFLGNNLIYFNYLFASLLIYRLTFIDKIKTNKKTSKKIKG